MLAFGATCTDARRAWLRKALARGRIVGLRLTADGVVERFEIAGEGPMRRADTCAPIGRLTPSPHRITLGIALTSLAVAAVAAVAASLWALGLSGPAR